METAEECQAAKPPNRTQKLQPSATLQKVASQEEATSDWQSLRDASLAAKQAKSKLVKLVRVLGGGYTLLLRVNFLEGSLFFWHAPGGRSDFGM